MKKLITVALAFFMILSMFNFTASAASKVGDVLGDVLYSDITAQINGYAIPTSVIQGKTLVAVEDLANYGFDVTWNAKEKSLKVELNRKKEFTPLKVDKSTKPTGTVKEKYFYTDIKTYLSSKEVESYAIKGVTLINFEDLGKYGKLNWDGKNKIISLTISSGKLEWNGYTFHIDRVEYNKASGYVDVWVLYDSDNKNYGGINFTDVTNFQSSELKKIKLSDKSGKLSDVSGITYISEDAVNKTTNDGKFLKLYQNIAFRFNIGVFKNVEDYSLIIDQQPVSLKDYKIY